MWLSVTGITVTLNTMKTKALGFFVLFLSVAGQTELCVPVYVCVILLLS